MPPTPRIQGDHITIYHPKKRQTTQDEKNNISNNTAEISISVLELHQRAKERISERREIDKIFAHEGFAASSCWDILLRFYNVEADSSPILCPNIFVSDACPPSTCVRWLRVLVNMGMLRQLSPTRQTDEVSYSLTMEGRARIEAVLKLPLSVGQGS